MSTRPVPPWQFEWKQPKWQSPTDDESDFYVEGVPLSTSSAQLSLGELETWEGKTKDDIFSINQSEGNDEVFFLLSATLYSTSKSNASSADVLFLELLRHDRAGVKRVKHRMLRWPGSTMNDEEKQEEEKSWNITSWIRAKPRPQVALVSVILCRRPDGEDSASFADAMDVVALLSLGLDASQSPAPPMAKPTDTRIPARRPQSKDETSGGLLLACLTTDGRVLLYSLQRIFCPDETKDSSHQLGNGLASLLLGKDIHGQLEQTVLPLSQPLAVLPLSVPLRRLQKTTEVDSETLDIIHEDEILLEESNEIHNEDAIVKHGLWEGTFWDATIEASTAIYHTVDNEPKLMIPAFDFIVVAGRGTRMRRRKQKTKSPSTTDSYFSGGSASPESEASKVVSKRRSTTGERWQENQAEKASETEKQKGEGKPKWVEYKEFGGFVTFISLRFNAETRTLYLPFAPKQLSAVVWGDMHFVIVLGDDGMGTGQVPLALAIRVDSSSATNVIQGEAPPHFRDDSDDSFISDKEADRGDKNTMRNPVCSVRRFHLIPIILPSKGSSSSEQVTALAVSSASTQPPAIALQYSSEPERSGDFLVTLNALQSFDVVPAAVASRAMGGYRRFGKDVESALVIKMHLQHRNVARIPHKAPPSTTRNTWCNVGQGWTLFGVDEDVFFICWEGSTATQGAFVTQIHSEEEYESRIDALTTLRLFAPVFSAVSPLQSSALSTGAESNEQDLRVERLQLPFTSSYRMPSFAAKRQGYGMQRDDVENIVKDALDSLSFEKQPSEQPIKAASTLRPPLSYHERSIRLVRHCSSWTLLDDTNEDTTYNSQVPVMVVQIGPLLRERFVLSLRKAVVDNESATPFNQVLVWLSQTKDYYTAASVALDLLHDFDCLRHLRRAKEHAGRDHDRSSLEGLLDGIVPLYSDSNKSTDEQPSPSESVLTQLADMTVGCLLKGGLSMSNTLENFVHHNSDYDPGRACLMLVSATVCTLSRDPKAIKSVLGADYKWPADDRVPIPDLVWPVRSLFRVGVARVFLPTVLQLLNAAIPDEIRRRGHDGATNTLPDALELCKSIVSMVVASSATLLMLGLKDEATGKRYWNSLDHDTRLELSLLSVDGTFPLLRQAEVRRWAVDAMDASIRSGSPVALDSDLPIKWLKKLCEACLVNAGCDLERFLFAEFRRESPEGSDKNASDGTQEHVETHLFAIEALAPSPGSGGLDFDLLLPALLLLATCDETWRDESCLATQTMLDTACYMAGRHRKEEPAFAFDAPKVMKQCALSGNVSAGANLIGGKNGLVLKCCDVLMKGAEANMDDAEDFILNDDLDKTAMWRKAKLSLKGGLSNSVSFELSDAHRTVLWLLDEHVLNVKTFGDFDTKHIRGKVDPVFAARSCFRTWYLLSHQGINSATAWLVDWLRMRLGIGQQQVSPKRLACSALACALLWPTTDEVVDIGELDASSDEALLANVLSVESLFLVQLTQSCCGLVESVPPSFAQEILRQVEVVEAKSKRLPSFHVDV